MPERRAGVEKAGFCRVLFFLAVEIGGRRTMVFFFLSGGRFFNGAEAELRRDGVAVFVGPCAFCLFFVWCVPAFYFGFCIAGLVWRCFCTRQLNRPCFFFIMVHCCFIFYW